MRHWDDWAVAATVAAMMGCRWLSIRQLLVLLPESWQSPLGLISPNWLFSMSLLPALLCIYTWYAIASSITCFRHPVKRTIFVSVIICYPCFTPCKYQSIKYYCYYQKQIFLFWLKFCLCCFILQAAIVQTMPWYCTDDNLLPKPMMASLTDTNIGHKTSMTKWQNVFRDRTIYCDRNICCVFPLLC